MNKWFRILFLCLIMFASAVSAEALTAGKAYIVSSINVNASQTIQPGQSYSLVPQVIVATGNENYVGSVSTFTGCYGTRRYIDGVDKGECFLGGLATASQDGLMSKEDKAKLDGINPSNYASSSHTHDDRYYTESEVDSKFGNIQAKSLTSTGYGNTSLTYYQTSEGFDGNSGWAHYIIANHGDGSSYYHYTIGLPFWDVPIYKRQTGNTSSVSGWHTFITSENISSQSVNYANSAGNADTVDGYHAGDLGKFYGIGGLLVAQHLSTNGWNVSEALDYTTGVNAWAVCSRSIDQYTDKYGVRMYINGTFIVDGGESKGAWSLMVPLKAGDRVQAHLYGNWASGNCYVYAAR